MLAALSACVVNDHSVQRIDGARLEVRTDEDYFWPAPFAAEGPGGELVTVDAFPIVTALVVRNADGTAMREADENLARATVTSHCVERSLGAPGPDSRFADGAWAFYPCSATGG